MSYILDALNKSEEEKKQHRTPGLNTIHQKPNNRTPGKRLWMIVASAVVILNLLGLIIWFVFLAEAPKQLLPKLIRCRRCSRLSGRLRQIITAR